MLSILIVNWNTREYLRACLESIQNSCQALNHEIIVVDNNSSDGSAEMVALEFPQVHLLASGENLGFAAGNNLAYEYSRGQWLWLLNPDTEVFEGAPQKLIAFLEADAKRGAVASALIDARTHKPQYSCRTFPTPAALWVEALGLARRFPRSRRFGFYRMGWWRYRDTRQVEQPMASSFLLRREAVENIGGLFDETFPIFFNDVDLCWRLKHNGWQIWYLSEAKVLHWGGAGTSQRRAAMIAESHRSLRRFYEKHYRVLLAPPIYYATLGLVALSGVARRWGLQFWSLGHKGGINYHD
jgi:GT2 family glycosyltransferase